MHRFAYDVAAQDGFCECGKPRWHATHTIYAPFGGGLVFASKMALVSVVSVGVVHGFLAIAWGV